MNAPEKLRKCMTNSLTVDTSLLTPRIKRVVDEYLSPSNTYIPKEALVNVLLVYLAQIANFNRLRVQSTIINNRDHTTPANMYSIIFMNSGSGKDRAQRTVRSGLLKEVYERYDEKVERYIVKRTEEVTHEAEEMTKVQRDKYIESNRPRFLLRNLGDATLEGFIALRESFSKAEFGGTFAQISELGDYILSDNNARSEFLTAVTEAYDFGDSNAKIIKGEKDVRPVEGVPSNIIFHTSLSGLLDGRGNEKLMSFFNRGLARRSFICYPIESALADIPDEDVDSFIALEEELKKSADRVVGELVPYFMEMYNSIELSNIFVCPQEIDDLLIRYELFNKSRASKLLSDSDIEGLRSEVGERHWKALKLAAIISAFEHPKVRKINEEDLASAVYIAELSGNHFDRFYNAKPLTDEEKLFNFFLTNQDKWLSKSDIFKAGFRSRNSFSNWFDQMIPLIDEMASKTGYLLEQKQGYKQWKDYRLTKKLAHDPKKLVEFFNEKETATWADLTKFAGAAVTPKLIETMNLTLEPLGKSINHIKSKEQGNLFVLIEG